jgi:transcriptional regulator with XRE-family HTH domain
LSPVPGSRAAAALPVEVGSRFGSAVRELREARGWSQERLAGRAELNRSYMGEIERATAMPSLATAAKLAVALGVPLSHLIARCEGSKVPQ